MEKIEREFARAVAGAERDAMVATAAGFPQSTADQVRLRSPTCGSTCSRLGVIGATRLQIATSRTARTASRNRNSSRRRMYAREFGRGAVAATLRSFPLIVGARVRTGQRCFNFWAWRSLRDSCQVP
jgi:hypothetical protein